MDDIEGSIRRRALWESDDLEAEEIRSYGVNKIGESVVDRLETIFLNAPESGSGPSSDYPNDTDGSAILVRGDLRDLIRSGRVAYRGENYQFKAPSECPDAVLTGEPDLPVYAYPRMINSPTAWADVCMPTEDWIRLMVSPFDGGPMKSLTTGLSPKSIERVRDGLRAGDEIPRGALEMERRRVGRTTYLVPTGQEGRNRGVAALLEGYNHVLGRLVAKE